MKKITALILSIIIAVTFFGCDNSSAETTVVKKTFKEKVEDLAYIAELKQYDASAAEKACVLHSEYQNLSESEKEALEHYDLLYDVLNKAEALTIAEVATELAIEYIKSDLLRPSSFELVGSLASIDLYPFLKHDRRWEIEVAIDYSAQTKGGGFDRKIEIVPFYLPRLDKYGRYEPSQECIKNSLIHSDERLYISLSDSDYAITNGILTLQNK